MQESPGVKGITPLISKPETSTPNHEVGIPIIVIGPETESIALPDL